MNNRKLIITMFVVISVLLTCAVILSALKLGGIDILKLASENINKRVETELAVIDLEDDSTTIEEKVVDKIIEENIQDTENINVPSGVNATIAEMVSSRSNIDRSIYVNINAEQKLQNDYEEVKTYIPLSQVKISFDMDVSKPTGLSKEDFVALVNRMKYDRTGILKKNAEIIWELCQKYNVNEIFVLGICGIESGWCSAIQHQRTHNYASLMSKGKLIPFESDEAGFEALIRLLGNSYLTPGSGLYHGKTITGVGTCYCNPGTWPKKVYKCMGQVFE